MRQTLSDPLLWSGVVTINLILSQITLCANFH